MKTSSVSLSILTATLFAIPAPARAEPDAAGTQSGQAARMGQRQQELIKRFDKNGDGRLDEDEKAAAHAAMRKEGRGGIGKQGKGGERMKQVLKRFDKDGDGRLNDAEYAEAQKARQQFEQNGGMAKFREKALERFDRDGDGRLNEEERAAAEKFRAGLLKKYDKDADGQLSETERGEAMKEFGGERPGAPAPGK